MRWTHQVGVIPLLADCFQERAPEVRELDDAVSAGRTAVLTQVLSGLGGVGKTQLAAAYARRVWDAGELDLLVWATARSRDAVQARYAQAAAEIGQPPPDVDSAAEWFLGWMQTTARRWLVVPDDLSESAPKNREARFSGRGWPVKRMSQQASTLTPGISRTTGCTTPAA